MQDILGGGGKILIVDRRMRPQQQGPLKCPRCDSVNTKFCYFNNYNLAQPRHFCRNCRRYWTEGGVLRNVPVGGGCRKPSSKRDSTSTLKSKPSDDNGKTTKLTTAPLARVAEDNKKPPPSSAGSSSESTCTSKSNNNNDVVNLRSSPQAATTLSSDAGSASTTFQFSNHQLLPGWTTDFDSSLIVNHQAATYGRNIPHDVGSSFIGVTNAPSVRSETDNNSTIFLHSRNNHHLLGLEPPPPFRLDRHDAADHHHHHNHPLHDNDEAAGLTTTRDHSKEWSLTGANHHQFPQTTGGFISHQPAVDHHHLSFLGGGDDGSPPEDTSGLTTVANWDTTTPTGAGEGQGGGGGYLDDGLFYLSAPGALGGDGDQNHYCSWLTQTTSPPSSHWPMPPHPHPHPQHGNTRIHQNNNNDDDYHIYLPP